MRFSRQYFALSRKGPILLVCEGDEAKLRLEDGKIVESWGNSDQLEMLRQIGVVTLKGSF